MRGDMRSRIGGHGRTIVALGLAAGLASCKPQQPAGAGVSQVPRADIPQAGYVLRAPEGPVPGLAVTHVQTTIHNPYGSNQGAIEEGRFLYIRMNCAYCHGFTGKGGMGPDLTDTRWRYGGSDVDIFSSIWRGRAKGMPAWGAVLTENQIWELAAYVRALGGANASRYAAVQGGGDARKTSVNTSNR